MGKGRTRWGAAGADGRKLDQAEGSQARWRIARQGGGPCSPQGSPHLRLEARRACGCKDDRPKCNTRSSEESQPRCGCQDSLPKRRRPACITSCSRQADEQPAVEVCCTSGSPRRPTPGSLGLDSCDVCSSLHPVDGCGGTPSHTGCRADSFRRAVSLLVAQRPHDVPCCLCPGPLIKVSASVLVTYRGCPCHGLSCPAASRLPRCLPGCKCLHALHRAASRLPWCQPAVNDCTPCTELPAGCLAACQASNASTPLPSCPLASAGSPLQACGGRVRPKGRTPAACRMGRRK
eukprot:365837-Chlamydomonas_euryale.AAC.1